MSGWDLVARAQERIGEFWSLTQSEVYRELSKMAELGLVEAGERGPRDKRPYTITDEGRSAFWEWVRQSPGEETIRFPLLLTLTFGRHVPEEDLTRFLASHRALHAERLAGYRQQREEMPADYAKTDPYAVSTLDFGIRYEIAVLKCSTSCP